MKNNALRRAVAEMQETINTTVREGFLDAEEIAAAAIQSVDEDADLSVVRAMATRLTQEALARHLQEQEFWPWPTDCDRLDAAFAALEQEGIICRQNFLCCGTCALPEIDLELQDERESGREVRGYVFYDEQCTSRAAAGDGLHLSYGSVDEGDDENLAIGHRVVKHLRLQGLSPQWNGSLDQRIYIEMEWRRRR